MLISGFKGLKRWLTLNIELRNTSLHKIILRENFRQNGRYILIIDQKCICRENSSDKFIRTRPG